MGKLATATILAKTISDPDASLIIRPPKTAQVTSGPDDELGSVESSIVQAVICTLRLLVEDLLDNSLSQCTHFTLFGTSLFTKNDSHTGDFTFCFFSQPILAQEGMLLTIRDQL